jgi:hypothetical protein
MTSFLTILKSLLPILEPIGEQGVNQLFSSVVDPAIASMSDSSDLKRAALVFAPAVKQFLIAELSQMK